jgi:hypothetical protein
LEHCITIDRNGLDRIIAKRLHVNIFGHLPSRRTRVRNLNGSAWLVNVHQTNLEHTCDLGRKIKNDLTAISIVIRFFISYFLDD